jgi:hypothetical protein
MKTRSSVWVTILFFGFSTSLAPAQTTSQKTTTPAATPTTPSTGTKIGTIVKDAITTALPAVGQIINLIWPAGSKDSSVKKSDVQSKLDTPALQATAQQSAKNEILKLGPVADELAMIEKFSKAAAQANQNVTTMQVLLSVSPQPANLLQRLQEEWGFASDWLAPLSDVTDDQLLVVSENEVGVQMTQLRDARKNLSGRITNRLKDKKAIKDVDLPSLTEYIATLGALLNGINAVATIEVGRLQKDVSTLVAWASKSQAIGDQPIPPDADLVKTVNQSRVAAQRLLASSEE